MSVERSIQAAASSLLPGGTAREHCPFCNVTNEKSFAISRDSKEPWKILFVCHRGKCAQSGMVLDKAGALLVLSPTEGEPQQDQAMSEHFNQVPGWTLNMLSEKYATSRHVFSAQGCRWEMDGQRLCMPWLSEAGEQIGWVEKRFDDRWHKSHHELALRSYQGRLAFPRTPFSYMRPREGRTAILVEGLLDAYRLLSHAKPIRSADPTPVALLGAQVSQLDAFKLARLFENIVVLLDPDQWPKGHMRVAERFAALPVEVRIMTLNEDPKDSGTADLDSLYDAIGAAF